MSNYNLQVTWSGKDALSDSDADKVISGDDFNTEFTAVKTAVNSKADLNGSASETFSAVTAASGTSTTQVATTAFVTTAVAAVDLSAVYPVGAIFTTVTAYANSAAVVAAIGGTTWVAFAAGKMLIGLDSGDTDFDTVEQTGGAKTHTLSTAEMPSHNHSNGSYTKLGISNGSNTTQGVDSSSGELNLINTADIQATGGGTAHSIMNPYIAVYMWKRTA
uniref:Phage capsid protein n=1 Tax=uncultured marine virus TaxID=186617 RepID=A0A0F7L5Y2_9VIRU|nr:phage capsid protein [uncultured marine virus]